MMSAWLLLSELVSGYMVVAWYTDKLETTLRQVVGGRVLQSVISDREGLAAEVAEIVGPISGSSHLQR